MASEDTPNEVSETTVTNEITGETKTINREELAESQKDFLNECKAIQTKYGLTCMIVAGSPPDAQHEYVYISEGDNPFYVLQTAVRLQEFYMLRETKNYEASKRRAEALLAQLQKLASGGMGKPPN